MPSLCLHLSLARDALPHLGEVVAENRGVYFLGATLPDIHLIRGVSRQDTHFVDLFKETGGNEVERFFQAYPHLAARDNHSSTRSLVAGYVSHLVTDHTWVRQIYHPYFGPGSPLGQDPLANLLDRTLQYELDRRQREQPEEIAATIQDIAGAGGAGTELFDAAAMVLWQNFVITSASRPPTWDRFPLYARRFLVTQGKAAAEQVEEFLATLPQKLSWLLEYVPAGEIAAFQEEAVNASVAAIRERLG